VNTPSGRNPEFFSATFTQPAPLVIGGQSMKFTIKKLAGQTSVRESTWIELADIVVTFFSPVPGPATYGLMEAMGLRGLGGYRRFRGGRHGGEVAAPAVV
jgi:hypothetical protein